MLRTEAVLVSSTDYLTPELLRLLTIAAQVLDRHVQDGNQRCQACGARWPCPRAELAAFALEAV